MNNTQKEMLYFDITACNPTLRGYMDDSGDLQITGRSYNWGFSWEDTKGVTPKKYMFTCTFKKPNLFMLHLRTMLNVVGVFVVIYLCGGFHKIYGM